MQFHVETNWYKSWQEAVVIAEREELYTFKCRTEWEASHGEVEEHQLKYFEQILRMPTNQTSQKLSWLFS
jgi:hypothetical protein